MSAVIIRLGKLRHREMLCRCHSGNLELVTPAVSPAATFPLGLKGIALGKLHILWHGFILILLGTGNGGITGPQNPRGTREILGIGGATGEVWKNMEMGEPRGIARP